MFDEMNTHQLCVHLVNLSFQLFYGYVIFTVLRCHYVLQINKLNFKKLKNTHAHKKKKLDVLYILKKAHKFTVTLHIHYLQQKHQLQSSLLIKMHSWAELWQVVTMLVCDAEGFVCVFFVCALQY